MECMRRIANGSQLCKISAVSVSQYGANEMGIRASSKYPCSLGEYLVTAGLTSLLNNGSPCLNMINVLTRHSLEGLLGRYLETFRRITYLRSKIRVTDCEKKKIVFCTSTFSFETCILCSCKWLLVELAVFLAKLFLKWIPKLGGLWADMMFLTDVAVYAKESPILYGVMMLECEDL